MAIDPSIILQAGKGVTPIESPFQLAQGAGQLAGMKQQLAMGQMHQQQAQMAMQDEQMMRQLAASGKYRTPDQMADAAMDAGVSPKTVMALRMQGADYQSKVAQTAQAFATAAQRGGQAQEAKIKAVGQQAQEARNLALTAPDEATYQAGLQHLDQKYAALGVPSLFQKYGAFTPQNRTLLATNGQTVQDATDAAFGKVVNGPTGPLLVKQPQIPGAAPQVSALAGSKPMPVMLPSGSTGFANPNPVTGEMPAGVKPIPPAQLTLAGMAGGAGVGKGISTEEDPMKALAALSPADQAMVKQLASRQITVGRAGGFQINSPANKALYGLAIRLNPSLSVMDNDAAKKMMADLGSSSPNSLGGRIDSANRMLGHAGDLIDALEKLKPGSGVMGKIGNVLSYPGEKAFGAEIGPVQFIKSKLMAEVNKLVTGGVPHAEELKADIENVPITATKEQWAKLIQSVANVGMEQVYAAQEKRANLLGKMDPGTSFLSSRAQAAVKKISSYAGEPSPEMAAPSGEGYTTTAIANKTPAPANAAPVQTKVNPANNKTYYLHSDGNYYLAPPAGGR